MLLDNKTKVDVYIIELIKNLFKEYTPAEFNILMQRLSGYRIPHKVSSLQADFAMC